jgi:hypothetical protein
MYLQIEREIWIKVVITTHNEVKPGIGVAFIFHRHAKPSICVISFRDLTEWVFCSTFWREYFAHIKVPPVSDMIKEKWAYCTF